MYSKQYLVTALQKQTAKIYVEYVYDSLLHVGKARPNWPGTRRKSSHWIDEDRPAWTKPCAVEPRSTPAVSEGPDSLSRTALRPLFPVISILDFSGMIRFARMGISIFLFIS